VGCDFAQYDISLDILKSITFVGSQTVGLMFGETIRILIVDDHEVVLKGITYIIAAEPDFEVVAATKDGEQAVSLFAQHLPDVAVVDIEMPKMNGLDVINAIRTQHPDARIVVLSAHNEIEFIYQAIQAGAMAYVLKESLADELVKTIRAVHEGKRVLNNDIINRYLNHSQSPSLSEREIEVLKLIANGLSNAEIGEQLAITEGTVKIHVHNILKKLSARDRTSAVVMALKLGLLTLRDDPHSLE
jgi:two-component system NarL family response regulator